MTVADLHVHTTASDGSLSLDRLAERARAVGLDAVAVTDHDRIHPRLDRPVNARDGVTVVRGIELRVEAERERVDLLGYGVRATDALTAELGRLQRDRVERARRIVEAVERETGVDLDVRLRPGIGRPHVARAVAESDAPYDYEGAFADLIGENCPCYVARDVTEFGEGARLLDEACGLVALAHPFRYEDPDAALELATDLDAVERFYPYGREVDPTPVDRVVEAHDLLPTGGSDAHGEEVGVAGLDGPAWDRVAERLPRA